MDRRIRTLISTVWLVSSIPLLGQVEQLPSYGGALIPGRDWIPYAPVEQQAARKSKLPQSMDLSHWFPPPGDQHRQYACIAFAWAYGTKSYCTNKPADRRYARTDTVDAKKTYSPSFLFNLYKQFADDHSCNTGVDVDRFMAFSEKMGLCNLADMPYDTAVNGCMDKVPMTLLKKAWSITMRNPMTSPVILQKDNELQWKQHLAANEPIIALFNVDRTSFVQAGYDAAKKGLPFVWDLDDFDNAHSGGHAVVCTGYNADSTFTFLNSYGPGWGETGYFRAKADALTWKCYGAYAFKPDPVPMDTLPPNLKSVHTGPYINEQVKVGETIQMNSLQVSFLGTKQQEHTAVVNVSRPDSLADPLTYHLSSGEPLSFYHGDQRTDLSYHHKRFPSKWWSNTYRVRARTSDSANDVFLEEQRAQFEQLKKK